ncbi:MAG TPA: type II secretion system minor pseudopilin GspJ [Allosphingosinicella sp.]
MSTRRSVCSCESRNPAERPAPLGSCFRRSTNEGGFTLIELLVALLIFGLVSAAGVALLSFSVRTDESAEARLEEIGALRRAGALLSADLAQAVPRLSRDEDARVQPAFRGGGSIGEPLLAFVRSGWDNPDGSPRPSLQKVEYRLSGDRLERIAYSQLDGASPRQPATILSGVRALRIRFHDAQGNWRERWDNEDPFALPRAVELIVATQRYGEVRQLFLVSAGQ